jgi:restriction endonuclease S subunit
LAVSNPQPVLISKSPSDSKAMKHFLGYEWSGAKGSEGIKYLGTNVVDENDMISANKGINQIRTPLFNPNNLTASEKINTLIRQNFNAETLNIPDSLKDIVSLTRLVDMIDFSRVSFDKSLRTSAMKNIEIESKYPLVDLGSICYFTSGFAFKSSELRSEPVSGSLPVIKIGNLLFNGQIDISKTQFTSKKDELSKYLIFKNDILVAMTGATVGKVAISNLDNLYLNQRVGLIRELPEKTHEKYLKTIVLSSLFYNYCQTFAHGGAQGNISPTQISTFKIPLPPLDIQQQIVTECEIIDMEHIASRKNIEENNKKIEELCLSAYNQSNRVLKLSDRDIFEISIGRRIVETELTTDGEIPVYSANVNAPFGKINKLLIDDFSKPSVIWGIDGDWMVNQIPANQPFYPTDHCGMLRVKNGEVLPHYLKWVLNKAGQEVRFSRSHRASIDRVSALSIKAPTLSIQQEIVNQIETYEIEIEIAKQVIEGVAIRKQAILDNLLKE